jgi:hypothetical protein
MNNDARDDELWLQALAGRSVRNEHRTQATASLEGQLLRAAMQQLPSPAPVALTSDDEQRLLQAMRAQAADKRAAPRCLACAERWRAFIESLPAWPAVAALSGALVLLGMVTLVLWRQVSPSADMQPPPMRSQAADVRVVAVADPQARRNAAATQLAAAGAEVRRYERLGRFGLDARFATPPSAQMLQALVQAELAPSPSGEVQLEFEAKAP